MPRRSRPWAWRDVSARDGATAIAAISPPTSATADIAAGFGGLSKVLRMVLQSAVLGIGAWLVINQQATAGIIIASSILTSRALAPIELAIAQWRGFVAARQSWRRLNDLLGKIPADQPRMALPKPAHSLAVEAVSIVPPGTNRVVVQDVAFQLKAGQGLGIIGPSASGKSSLARAIVGVWPAARGRVRIDGAALDQWSSEALGPHIGYLPQDMELFAGTVAENIARFEPQPSSEAVIAAATAAGVHELILRPAGRLRDRDRRGRCGTVGRPAPAHRPCPGALRRSLPGGARRAQRQSRQRRRRGPDPRHTGRSRAGRHRHRDRPSAERARGRRHPAGDAGRTPGSVRAEGGRAQGSVAARSGAGAPCRPRPAGLRRERASDPDFPALHRTASRRGLCGRPPACRRCRRVGGDNRTLRRGDRARPARRRFRTSRRSSTRPAAWWASCG